MGRIRDALNDSYEQFKDRNKTEFAKGGAYRSRDVLSDFAYRLSIDRSTLNRYLNGTIRNPPFRRVVQSLHLAGVSLADVYPSEGEISVAILKVLLPLVWQERSCTTASAAGFDDVLLVFIDQLSRSSAPAPEAHHHAAEWKTMG